MSDKQIIVYHYPYSPYARKVLWYLTLRGIPYTQCLQPAVMPRPDLAALGVAYRRIPVMAIGRDVYCDTRLQLAKLEELFPPSAQHPAIAPQSAEHQALTTLLEKWTNDTLFTQGSRLIPTNLPLLQDPKFQKDRLELSGRGFDAKTMEMARPEAMVYFCDAFAFLESLLSDGRQWILKTEKPTLADLQGVWIHHWGNGMKAAFDANVINPNRFPKTFAWIDRFDGALKAAQKAQGKPTTVKGQEATQQVLNAPFAENVRFDAPDPLGLKGGEQVRVWPTDTGFNHRDSGKLVGLDQRQIVIERKAEDGKTDVRIHFPRLQFRIKVDSDVKL